MGLKHTSVLVFLPLLLFGCSFKYPKKLVDPATSGTFYSASLKTIPPSEILSSIQDKEVIFIGEGHTNPCDHDVQKDIIARMAEAGISFDVGLEMVDITRQHVLDRWNRGELDPDTLEKALDWGSTWGHAYDLYKPVFEVIHTYNIPLVALNVPSTLTRKISRKGLSSLSSSEKQLLPHHIIPPVYAQRSALKEQFSFHQEMLGKDDDSSRLEQFLLIQSLWDSAMAENAVKWQQKSKKPLVILAGNGHVEFGWGIPHRMRTLKPQTAIMLLSPWRGLGSVYQSADEVSFYCPNSHRSRFGFELIETEKGLLITEVIKDTQAAQKGFKANDLIIKLNGEPVRQLFDLHSIGTKARKEKKQLTFTLKRGWAYKSIVLNWSDNE